MQRNVYLPQIELNMEGITVNEWFVNPGERVEADQPILEVETQKAAVDVPTSESGFVRLICVKKGETVGEKSLLCILTDSEDEPFHDPNLVAPLASPNREQKDVPFLRNGSGDNTETKTEERIGIILAAPAARKLAKELGVDLAHLKGSGPEGRINVEDVRLAAVKSESIATRGEVQSNGWTSLPPTRRALNEQMQKSLAEIPQIHILRQFDVSALVKSEEGITFTHRLAKAVASALVKHPRLRTITDGVRVKTEPVNVAVAMDTPHGLLAPVVREADTLSLEQIASALKHLRQRATSNALKREELINGPFAITNLGMLGVDVFNAFVFYGQTAVLAVGRATDNDKKGKAAWFSLAVDHRVVDGAEAARFLKTLQEEVFNL